MSIEAKTKWVGEEKLLLEVTLSFGKNLVNSLGSDKPDLNLQAEVKAALVNAARDKAAKIGEHFDYI